MLNKNRTRRLNTDAWDYLYTKFERYLDIWSLNYHYHKIIILAQFKDWCKHPLRNYPSITKRRKYASCFWTCNRATRPPSWNYFQPRFSRTKRLFNPVFRPIISFYDGRSLSFPLFFFYLSFMMAIERTITVHTGRRTDEWLEGRKKDRLTNNSVCEAKRIRVEIRSINQ